MFFFYRTSPRSEVNRNGGVQLAAASRSAETPENGEFTEGLHGVADVGGGVAAGVLRKLRSVDDFHAVCVGRVRRAQDGRDLGIEAQVLPCLRIGFAVSAGLIFETTFPTVETDLGKSGDVGRSSFFLGRKSFVCHQNQHSALMSFIALNTSRSLGCGVESSAGLGAGGLLLIRTLMTSPEARSSKSMSRAVTRFPGMGFDAIFAHLLLKRGQKKIHGFFALVKHSAQSTHGRHVEASRSRDRLVRA